MKKPYEEEVYLKTADGATVALWKVYCKNSKADKHILLTHGTFSNRKVLTGIATYLADQDYTCWILEWRNHGHSKKSDQDFDFETIAEQDLHKVFQYLFDSCSIDKLHCITHSGGGICLTISLIIYPHYQSKISSITLFACQAFGASTSISNYLKIWVGKYLSKIIGKIPADKMGKEEAESYYFMRQWFDWNLNKDFIGKSGVDYREEMKAINIPVLAIYGAGDTFIAPAQGCLAYLDAFNNQKNKALFCSIKMGYKEDYNHSRILHSQSARKEIYPQVLEWIKRYKV